MCTLRVFIHTCITVPRNIQICITYLEATQWCQISQFQVSYHSSQIVFSCITDTIPTLSTNPNKAHLLRSLFAVLIITTSHQTFSGQFWCLSSQNQHIHYTLSMGSECIFRRQSNVRTNFNPYHKHCCYSLCFRLSTPSIPYERLSCPTS